ncbi:MAG: SH3 domain-containing protein [Bryobacteraceae bacterium]
MRLAKITACSAALCGAFLALSAQYATAAPALATTNVNLRQGPGTTYAVVTTIPGGSTVDVAGCSGEWCQVGWHGQNGFVIATSLDQGGPGGPGGPPPAGGPPPGAPVAAYPPGYVPPPVYIAPPPVYVAPPPYYYGYGPYYGGWRGGYHHHHW